MNQKILNKDLEKYGDNEYHLHIPYAGDDYVLNYTVGENKIERPFCAVALIVHILTGYEELEKIILILNIHLNTEKADD